MSHALAAEARDDRTTDERMRELDAIAGELRVVAASDCAYAHYCQNWLAVLEEARTDG